MGRPRAYGEDISEFRYPEDFEWRESRPLNRFEKQCMSGHALYLDLLDKGVIQSENQPSSLIQSTKKSRGKFTPGMKVSSSMNMTNPQLKQALEEFNSQSESMYKFCKTSWIKYNYKSVLGMYSSLRLSRRSSTRAVAQKPKKEA